MSFSINTNIASLQAQNYLRVNSAFQQKTINQVTSGLRIVNSGDDAAGLAVANGMRSSQTVLTQGIANANDGLSQLQIADGGMSNISQLLDRASTLATQSASGTFTGDRNVLNAEFQSVMGEIDRQSQAIGLNQNGTFAKALSVFIGGGKGLTSGAVIANGSLGIDLTTAAVDTKGLGLNNYRALGSPDVSNPADLGNKSASSVAKILAQSANTGTEATTGFTDFYLSGPGFSDPASGANPIKVHVNVKGVTDTDSLVAAVNSAITTTAAGTTDEAKAFAKAGITASIVTDSNGHQQLAFSSAGTAFQVQAGDAVANAFLGNFSDRLSATGASALSEVTGTKLADAGTTGGAVNLNIKYVDSTGAAQNLAQTGIVISASDTIDDLVGEVNSGMSAAQAAVVKAVNNNGALAFQALTPGTTFQVQVGNDAANDMGFGTFVSDASNNNEYTTIAGGAIAAAGAGTTTKERMQISVGNRVVDLGQISIGNASTETTLAAAVNTAIAGLGANDKAFLAAAGITGTGSSKFATADTTGHTLVLTSSNSTKFSVNVYDQQKTAGSNANGDLGIGTVATAVGTAKSNNVSSYAAVDTVNSGGVQESQGSADTNAYTFTGLTAAGETQSVSFSGQHSDGTAYNFSVALNTTNAGDIDSAVATLNAALQKSNDPSLQQMLVVKEQVGKTGVEGIRVLSPSAFSVNFSSSAAGQGLSDAGNVTTPQGEQLNSTQSAGAGLVDVSSQTSAEQAVTALSNATGALGNAQAIVGRGENEFNYAINLAQSQVTNLAAAESQIRDADLAAESANLTKAQILIQAGVAALAQANSAPQQVLSLLQR